jgi:hypothetical protein
MDEGKQPSALASALHYHDRGWAVVPVTYREKRPAERGWQNRRLTEDDIRHEFAALRNVGVLLGEPSHGLVDIDLDVPEAATVARRLLPATSSFGRPSKPCSHLLYLARGELATKRFSAPDHTNLLELRSTGAQTVFPSSTHPSGEPIEWKDERDPLPIDAAELLRLVSLVAACTLLARAWPVLGARHDASLALAGGLLTS